MQNGDNGSPSVVLVDWGLLVKILINLLTAWYMFDEILHTCFFVDHFCYLCLVFVFAILCSLVATCWERADLLSLLFVMFLVFLSLSHTVSWVKCGT